MNQPVLVPTGAIESKSLRQRLTSRGARGATPERSFARRLRGRETTGASCSPAAIAGALFAAAAATLFAALPASVAALESPPPGPAGSGDLLSLELAELMEMEIVSTASRYDQKTSEAPAPVTIVTSEEIRAFGYRTLSDILRSVRGFTITYDHNYEYVGARGVAPPGDYSTRVLVLIDGHRANDNVYDQAMVGTEFPLDLDFVERVEVVHGPASSIYGANAFFAVVNVITRDAGQQGGLRIAAELGSDGAYRTPVSFGRRLKNGLEYVVGASAFGSRGLRNLYFAELDDPATNDGVAADADDDRYSRIFAKARRGGVSLQAAWSMREKGIPTGSYGTVFNDDRARTTDGRSYVALEHESSETAPSRLRTRLTYDRVRYAGDYPYEGEEGGVVVNRDEAFGHWLGAEAHFSHRAGSRHQLALGTEERWHLRRHQLNFDPGEVFLDDDRSGWDWSLYGQDEVAVRSRLTLISGARYDRHSTFGGHLSPRFALVQGFGPSSAIKLLYGEAFRPPNAYEFYYDDGESTRRTPEGLRPETIRAAEAVVEHYLSRSVRAMASVFRYRMDNLIADTVDPESELVVFANIDKAETRGINVEVEGRAASGFRVRASGSLQEATNETTGERLVNSPRTLVRVGGIAPLWRDDLLAGVEVQHTGRRGTVTAGATESFVLTNATLSWREPVQRLELSASVRNVFDARYDDPASNDHPTSMIPQPGRSLWLRAAINL